MRGAHDLRGGYRGVERGWRRAPAVAQQLQEPLDPPRRPGRVQLHHDRPHRGAARDSERLAGLDGGADEVGVVARFRAVVAHVRGVAVALARQGGAF